MLAVIKLKSRVWVLVIANRAANLLAFISLNLNYLHPRWCWYALSFWYQLFESWPKCESGKRKTNVFSTPATVADCMNQQNDAKTTWIHLNYDYNIINWIIICSVFSAQIIWKWILCEHLANKMNAQLPRLKVIRAWFGIRWRRWKLNNHNNHFWKCRWSFAVI